MQGKRNPKDRRKLLVIYLRADNDVNGNPRRVYVVMDRNGFTVDAIDEGYLGEQAFLERYPNARKVKFFDVELSEYRYWTRDWPKVQS